MLVPSKLAYHKLPTSHQGMIFSRNFLLKNRYEQSYKIAGDFDLYLRASKIKIVEDEKLSSFVDVEWAGFASRNPKESYLEYLRAIRLRLKGWERIKSLIRVAARAVFVVSAKISITFLYEIFSVLRRLTRGTT